MGGGGLSGTPLLTGYPLGFLKCFLKTKQNTLMDFSYFPPPSPPIGFPDPSIGRVPILNGMAQ